MAEELEFRGGAFGQLQWITNESVRSRLGSQAARQTSHLSCEFYRKLMILAAEVSSSLFDRLGVDTKEGGRAPLRPASHLSKLFLVQMRVVRPTKFDAATLHRHPDFMFSDTSFE